VAARERQPLPSDDGPALLKERTATAMTALIGAVIGASIGLAGGFLEPDLLGRQWGTAGLFALLGGGIAVFTRKAILLGHRQASGRAALGRPWWERLPFVLGALAVDASVLAVDLLVEREGLLRLARVNAGIGELGGHAAGPTTLPFVWYLIPAVVTLGYV